MDGYVPDNPFLWQNSPIEIGGSSISAMARKEVIQVLVELGVGALILSALDWKFRKIQKGLTHETHAKSSIMVIVIAKPENLH